MSNYTKWSLSFENKKDNTDKNICIINRDISEKSEGLLKLNFSRNDENKYEIPGETNGCQIENFEEQIGIASLLVDLSIATLKDITIIIEANDEYGSGDVVLIKNGNVKHNGFPKDGWDKPTFKRFNWQKAQAIKKHEKEIDEVKKELFACAKVDLYEDLLSLPEEKRKKVFKYITDTLKG